MTELDQLINEAYQSEGQISDANKVYTALLRTYLFVPIHKQDPNQPVDEAEPFKPLFAQHGDLFYMMAFDDFERYQTWLGDHGAEIDFVKILGRDLIRGVGEQIVICLNFGSSFYKEFTPDEIQNLKRTVAKLDQIASNGSV